MESERKRKSRPYTGPISSGHSLHKLGLNSFLLETFYEKMGNGFWFCHLTHIPQKIVNKPEYMATQVACRWAGAVINQANQPLVRAVTRKPPLNTETAKHF